MLIQVYPCQPFGTNSYVVAADTSSEAVVIDPGLDSFPQITSFLKEKSLQPIAVFLTHTHWDHIVDVARFQQALNLPVYVHREDAPNLIQPGADHLPTMFPIKGCTPDHYLEEDQVLMVGPLHFKVIHTPGHSPGGVCFYLEKENVLFSGDTLFKGTIGNLSFPTSDPEQMWVSLHKLANLPPETLVYPGHGPSTTIGREPWLANAKDIFGNV